MVAILIILFVVLVIIIRNVRIVPQEHAYVIERLGKFQTIWYAGIHVKIPFIDNIVNKISLKEQVFDFPPQPVITKDNVSVKCSRRSLIRRSTHTEWRTRSPDCRTCRQRLSGASSEAWNSIPLSHPERPSTRRWRLSLTRLRIRGASRSQE